MKKSELKKIIESKVRKALSEGFGDNGKLINDFLKSLGFKNIKIDDKDITNKSWTDLGTINIPVDSIKQLAPMFTKINVIIKAGLDALGSVVLELDYRYEHPGGGTNGYTVTYKEKNGKLVTWR